MNAIEKNEVDNPSGVHSAANLRLSPVPKHGGSSLNASLEVLFDLLLSHN